VLSATGPAALAQPASAQAPNLPKACVATEALVGDGASGSSIGAGEVLRVSPGGQSTLTTNTAPMGTPNLDDPTDMAFLSNGDIAVTDDSFTIGRPDVVEVNPSTGARTLVSGNSRDSGPALVMPATVAVEASGCILVTDVAAGTGNPAPSSDPGPAALAPILGYSRRPAGMPQDHGGYETSSLKRLCHQTPPVYAPATCGRD